MTKIASIASLVLGCAKSGASRAAVAAYNRHVAQIDRLGRLVERERLRLNRTL
jgi:hypothetical protein